MHRIIVKTLYRQAAGHLLQIRWRVGFGEPIKRVVVVAVGTVQGGFALDIRYRIIRVLVVHDRHGVRRGALDLNAGRALQWVERDGAF